MIDKIPKVIALFETTLASAINATATTLTLTSGIDKDGNTLPAGTYGITIDEGNANEEFVVAEITDTTGTNAKRGVSVSDGTTEVTALKKSHRRGASVKITNSPALVIISRVLRGEEEVDYEPTSAKHLATKEYVDDIAFGDVQEASETAAGFAEVATEDEAAAGTEDGSVGRLVLPASLATQTAGTAKRIPITDTDGKLNDFIDNQKGAVSVQTFLASGTWTKPENGTLAIIECWGAGGGGGYGIRYSGGGGGAYVRGTIPLADLGATETVTIGAGGAAGASGATTGGNGGNTTFGAHVTAYGGGGGSADYGGGGGGVLGAGSDGDTNYGAGGAPLGGEGDTGADTNFGGGGSKALTGNVGTSSSAYGGGGGGRANSGGKSIYGGGGGGVGGGTSVFGGNGGNASGSGTATAGQQPAGGGGGTATGTAAAGGAGMVRVTVI